jgi:hypothetical protein
MFYGQSELMGARHLWKVKAPTEFKFFWLTLQDCCWTLERLRRHGLSSDSSCALCSQCDESINHLILSCVFSREVWVHELRSKGRQHVAPSDNSQLGDWWLDARKRIAKVRRRAFDSVVLLISRKLWLERNDRVFSRSQATPAALSHQISTAVKEWCRARLLYWSELTGE